MEYYDMVIVGAELRGKLYQSRGFVMGQGGEDSKALDKLLQTPNFTAILK